MGFRCDVVFCNFAPFLTSQKRRNIVNSVKSVLFPSNFSEAYTNMSKILRIVYFKSKVKELISLFKFNILKLTSGGHLGVSRREELLHTQDLDNLTKG